MTVLLNIKTQYNSFYRISHEYNKRKIFNSYNFQYLIAATALDDRSSIRNRPLSSCTDL